MVNIVPRNLLILKLCSEGELVMVDKEQAAGDTKVGLLKTRGMDQTYQPF